MIRFAVIDDDEAMLNLICEKIKRGLDKSEQVELIKYSSGELFLEDLEEGKKFHGVFTDIQMRNLDGIELGKKVIEICSDIYIVFITSYINYAVDSYIINAFQYILKQHIEERLPIVVDGLINRINSDNQQYLMVKINDGKMKIYYKNVIYIYKAGKYVYFVTEDGEYRERTTLQKVFKELESREFVLVERGYIVNMKHIYKLSGDIIYLKNNYQVKISEAKLYDVKRQINCYWGE